MASPRTSLASRRAQPLTRTERRVLAGTAVVTTACVFPAFLVGAVAVQLRDDLGFSASGTGVGVAAFFGAAAASSLLLGRFVERIGPRRGMFAAVAVSAGASLSIALFARSLATLAAFLVVGGSANALCQPSANLLVARHLPAGRQGVAFAVKQAAIPFSTLLAGVSVPALALTVGWRWAFAAAALLSLSSVALVPRVGTEPVVRRRRVERSGDVPAPIMAMLAVGIGLGAAAGGTLGSFLVSAAVDSGMSEGHAGELLTFGSLAGIGVRIAAGLAADRRGGGHLRVVASMLGAGAVAFCLLALHTAPAYLVGAPLAFGTAWAWPGLFNLAIVRANPRSPAAATGITQTGTYFGAVAGPVLFGVLADRAGYREAWLAAAALAAASATAMVIGRARLRRWRAQLSEASTRP